MNFFKRIKTKWVDRKKAKAFWEFFFLLNSELTNSFKTDKRNMYITYSDLSTEDLIKLKIPHAASYEWDPKEAYNFGHISILYDSKKFTVYAKGYEPEKRQV